MRRLDRYFLAEILGPLALGLLVYTFILLMQFLFRSAEMILRRGIPVEDVGRLLMLTLPNILVLTIPMSLLFAILVGVGRLSADSELIALRSCGVSLFSLFRPILLLSLLLTALTGGLMLKLLPAGNHALQRLRIELFARSVTQQVQPRVFYEEWEGLVVYVFESLPDNRRWRGVFVAETLPGRENQVTVAEYGRVIADEEGERLFLELENAAVHKLDFEKPRRYQITSQRLLRRLVEDQFSTRQRARVAHTKGLREKTLSELRETLADSGSSREILRLARVEIHKKFAIPTACLVFGLVALPLGFSGKRGGRASSFVLSIVVILFYYVLLTNGEEAARVGKLAPWVAMWLPNVLLAALGLALLVRRNRDRPLLLPRLAGRLWEGLAPLVRRVQRRGRRERRGPPRPPNVLLRFPRLRLRFPNLLDRYVMRQFLGVFVLVLLSAVAVFVVANLTETIDDILSHDVPARVVADYYKYLSLQVVYDMAPISVLVTTLVGFGLLARNNEVVAARALGISLFRLAVPAVAVALGVTAACAFLESEVLPATNKEAAQLLDRIKGRETARTYRRADRPWLFGQGRYIYNYRHYDPNGPALARLQVFEFDDSYALIRRLYTEEARFTDDGWVFAPGWVRSFADAQLTDFAAFDEPRIVDYPETPAYFESEFKPPDQMSFGELREYVRDLKASGQAVPELEVQLHKKVAFPAVSVVMALVALPFAFRMGRRGALYGLGIALILGMVFIAVFALFTTLGETGTFPPPLAVWAPNVAFALASVYLFLGVQT